MIIKVCILCIYEKVKKFERKGIIKIKENSNKELKYIVLRKKR